MESRDLRAAKRVDRFFGVDAGAVQNFGGVDPVYDLNSDGIVDALDLEMIAMHIGEVAEPRQLTREEKQAEKQRRKDYKKSVKERQKANKKASKQQVKDTRRGG